MRTLLLSFALLAVPAAASAQVCPYGLVAVDAAHCCWPGQAFAPERGTCAGVPQCPLGLVPYGETCIAASAAQPPPQPPPAPAQPQPPPNAYLPMQPQMQMQMQPMPQVFGYQVQFKARRESNEFSVSVDNGISCRTPCELTVPPGRHRVKVEGDARFDDRLNFPAGPSTVQIEKRRGGGVALGVVSLAIGIPAAVVGGFVGLLGYLNTSNGIGAASMRNTMYGGLGVMAAGVTLAAVGGGVGFGIAGKNRVRFARASADEPGETPPVQLLSMGVAPTKGGGMAGATFAF
ncbi:MAG TPA: hypothetical protein VGK67_13685 [Myxococcales bacterium]|jgi:hypothetical protein